MLIGAVLIELAIALGCLLVPLVAKALGHRPPTVAGWAVAAAAAPVLLAADALDKWIAARRREATTRTSGQQALTRSAGRRMAWR